MTKRVAVVIVNYNCIGELPGCIETLIGSPEEPEIIIVDNASTDGSVELVERRFPSVRVVRNSENRGLAAGNNAGIATTDVPIIVMSNPDIRFNESTLREIVDCFESHPRAGIVGPKMFDRNGTLRTSVAPLPRLRDAVRGRYWSSDWPHNVEQKVGQVTEACYAARRAALSEVGGLDESFFLYWEGADLANRLRERGWETWFCPRSEAIHGGGATVDSLPWRRIVWSHRGAYRYFRLHSRVPALILAATFSLRALYKFVIQAVRGTESQIPPVSARGVSQ